MLPEVSSSHLGCTPVALEVKVEVACVLPGLMEAFATSIPSVKRVPQQCRVVVSKTFTTLLRNCSVSSGARTACLEAVFLVSQVCPAPTTRDSWWQEEEAKAQRDPARRLVGEVEALERGSSRCALGGGLQALFGLRKTGLNQLHGNNIRRATECAQDARYGKAVASLLSLGLCPATEENLEAMKSKHPEAALPVLPDGELPEPVRFDKELVRKQVDGFPTGSAAGASGMRPQLLKDILSCPNKAAGDEALTSLTKLTNHMVAGLAPRELAPFIAGAPLMALAKAGGGLRPIAIGETIRRLVSKCCCEATVEDAKVIFGPLQVGVATQGGAEASVHAVRRLAEEFGADPGRIMLKVDFSNAFNLVDRTEMLAQVYDKLPGLYRWVKYCYSHPALVVRQQRPVKRGWRATR